MKTDTVVMHYIRPTPDGSTTMTLCGCRIITDYQATAEAKATGNWVTCPECELRKTLDDMGLEDERHQEDGAGYTQPTLF